MSNRSLPSRPDTESTVCRTDGCGEPVLEAGDGWNGFCPSCADRLFGKTCAECGEPMLVEEGTEVSHHVTEDGDIDYQADADHVAIDDDGYGQL